MCGAILRPFNSISCRWEGGNDMCILDPVYSRKDCRLQLIPGTARFNLPSYRNSNSFQTWPCRYNYVHLIQCNHTHNLKHLLVIALTSQYYWGWSGGAKVLGKLPVPGRPTNLAYSRARAYCAFSRCGWGLFGHFFSHLSLLFSFSLSLGDGPI